MKERKARIEVALRRLEEQETLVAIYKKVINQFEQSGQPSEVGTKMLQSLEHTLAKFRADVARLSN
jgi:hypothetical protein